MFKFKKRDKLAPTIGMYFWYGTNDNICKICRMDEHKCYFAWIHDKTSTIIKTSGTYFEVFKAAIKDGTYHIIPEEEHYRIPELLKKYSEELLCQYSISN